MSSLRIILFALTLFGCFMSAPANAQATAYAAGQGGLSRIEVGIDVRASVRNRCSFAASGIPSGTIDQAEFDRVGLNRQFNIQLDCTSASRIAVSSANGGLVHANTTPGYAAYAPYAVELMMIADNGTRANAICVAASLKTTGSCVFSGVGSATNGLLLNAASTKANGSYLKVTAPAYSGTQPLLAGSYSDTLIITISVAP